MSLSGSAQQGRKSDTYIHHCSPDPPTDKSVPSEFILDTGNVPSVNKSSGFENYHKSELKTNEDVFCPQQLVSDTPDTHVAGAVSVVEKVPRIDGIVALSPREDPVSHKNDHDDVHVDTESISSSQEVYNDGESSDDGEPTDEEEFSNNIRPISPSSGISNYNLYLYTRPDVLLRPRTNIRPLQSPPSASLYYTRYNRREMPSDDGEHSDNI